VKEMGPMDLNSSKIFMKRGLEFEEFKDLQKIDPKI
jgi:hypothetical protein